MCICVCVSVCSCKTMKYSEYIIFSKGQSRNIYINDTTTVVP